MINVDFIDSSEVTTERIYQWDIGRKLKISNIGSAVAPVVHFCNKKSENALAVESNISGDYYIASIPNTLLQEEYDIIAYIYVGSEEEAKTIKVVHIPVSKRLKPETYVTTEDENVIDFLTISTEMKSLLNGLVITDYDSTKSYIKPNIVYYKGSSYICISETSITNILPTDTTKWGLMCESGANISEITFSNDVLHFKLQNNDIVDVPLGSIDTNTVEIDPVVFNITKDENGILKIGDVIIPQKKVIFDEVKSTNNGTIECYFTETLKTGDVIEINYSCVLGNCAINKFIKVKVGSEETKIETLQAIGQTYSNNSSAILQVRGFEYTTYLDRLYVTSIKGIGLEFIKLSNYDYKQLSSSYDYSGNSITIEKIYKVIE